MLEKGENSQADAAKLTMEGVDSEPKKDEGVLQSAIKDSEASETSKGDAANVAEEKDGKDLQEKVILMSNDGEEFEVQPSEATQSVMIKNVIEDRCEVDVIPLPNVCGRVLAKIVEYWKRHNVVAKGDDNELKKFDKELVKAVDNELIDLLMAANYLDCKPLMDLTCQAIADHIKDFTVEEAREFFGIKNDFTPEEEAKLREEHAWAFD